MTRELLSNRRKCSTRSFDHAGMKFDVCAGHYPDGRIGEIFLSSSKPGSAIEAVARDAAIVTSLALQFGCPINVIRHALTKDLVRRAELIRKEIEKNPAKNSAEYLAQFRSDIAGFISREELDACVMTGVFERLPDKKTAHVAFADMAAGGRDEHALCVAHRNGDRLIVDAIRARRGSPEAAVTEFSELMKSYGISTVKGDNFAKAWPQEAFRRHGIQYIRADQVRSDIYLACAPLIRGGRVELLDHPKCLLQFSCLEQKTSPGGKEQVNHPPGGSDDGCNAVAGAVVTAAKMPAPFVATMPFIADRPRSTSIHDYSNHPGELAASAVMPGIAHGPEY